MSVKDGWKRVQRALARWTFYLLIPLFKMTPYRWLRRMFTAMTAIGFFFVRRKRANARESLAIAFGSEKSEAERDKLLKVSFFNTGRGMAELLYYTRYPHYITEKVSIEGAEHLRAALSLGKGVVGATAHMGNLPLMLYRLGAEDFSTSVIIRPSRDKAMEQYFHKTNQQNGVHTIYSVPARTSVLQGMKALRENHLLVIPMDQNYGSAGGIYVDFFGKLAATATGAVVLAMRNGSAIVPMFTVRDQDDTHKIIIEPLYTIELKSDDRETIVHNTAVLTKKIEGWVRQYPHEWTWMHRRWKSRPAEEHVHG